MQMSDARLLKIVLECIMGERYSKTLSNSSENTARLANLTIVLRLIKKTLTQYVKVSPLIGFLNKGDSPQ